jgi:hypothetical protein
MLSDKEGVRRPLPILGLEHPEIGDQRRLRIQRDPRPIASGLARTGNGFANRSFNSPTYCFAMFIDADPIIPRICRCRHEIHAGNTNVKNVDFPVPGATFRHTYSSSAVCCSSVITPVASTCHGINRSPK